MVLTRWRLRLLTLIAVVVAFALAAMTLWDGNPLFAPSCPLGVNCSS